MGERELTAKERKKTTEKSHTGGRCSDTGNRRHPVPGEMQEGRASAEGRQGRAEMRPEGGSALSWLRPKENKDKDPGITFMDVNYILKRNHRKTA